MNAPGDLPAVVSFRLEGPRRQRRATVAFRLLLAFPHLLYVSVLSMLASVVVVIGWFAALVTGRLPDGIGTLLARIVAYVTRVWAYVMLLTDRFPSFALDDDDGYPVSVSVPTGTRLNRVSVLFRLVLLVPVGIVVQLVAAGYAIAAPFVWLVVFVAGRLPGSLFESSAAVLRYQARYYSFAAMLTSEYPRGLFGDRGGQPAVATAPTAWAPPEPPSPERLLAAVPVVDDRPPLISRLVLSKAAKRIVVLFIVLGVVSNLAWIVLSALLDDRVQVAEQFDDDYTELVESFETFSVTAGGCALAGGADCLRDALGELRDEVTSFQEDLNDLELPVGAIAVAGELDDTVTEMGEVLDALAATDDPAEYQRLALIVSQLGTEIDRLASDLYDAILVS